MARCAGGADSFVAQPLHQLRVGTRLDAIVQRLERHPTLGKPALELLVAVVHSLLLSRGRPQVDRHFAAAQHQSV
jgi:hypothetical protein